ncbi:MAG: YdcF family protein [Ruminococcaceae bacterium]|nr:YdcF family protein [Oscillospiraceae bacterium]
MKKKNKIILTVLLAVVALVALYVIGTAISIVAYSKVDETRVADCAIVLGAGVWDDEPSPVFTERINHAVLLYENGYVKKLIFTGGISEGDTLSEADVAKAYACEKGVPGEDILTETESHITQENINNAKKIMDENGIETALIVSDPLHMKRAMLMAKDYGIEAFSSPTKTSKYVSLKTKLPFLAREEFYFIGYKAYKIFFGTEKIW